MKRHLPFLSEVRQTLRIYSPYSIVQTCIVLLVFPLLTINCGPLPQQEQTIVPETTPIAVEKTSKMPAKQGMTKLPESATVDLEKQHHLRIAFREPPSVQSRIALYNFLVKTHQNGQPAAVIVNCSFDVLKAFVAKGWAPIVMLRIQGRRPVILPVTHYNDQSGRVHLQNPFNLSTRKLSYEDFEKSWKIDPQHRCIIITRQRLTEANVQKVLNEYLPAEALQKIGVKTD